MSKRSIDLPPVVPEDKWPDVASRSGPHVNMQFRLKQLKMLRQVVADLIGQRFKNGNVVASKADAVRWLIEQAYHAKNGVP